MLMSNVMMETLMMGMAVALLVKLNLIMSALEDLKL